MTELNHDSYDHEGQFVSWKQFVVTIIPLLTVPILVCWFLIQSHAVTMTHPGAVTSREFEFVVRELKDIKRELRELRRLTTHREGKIYHPKIFEFDE